MPYFNQVAVCALHQAIHHFNNIQARTQSAVNRTHFETDNTAADNQQFARYFFQGQCAAGVKNSRIFRDERQFGYSAACCNDTVFEGNDFFLTGRSRLFIHFAGRQRNFQVVRIQELAVTLDNVYFTAFSHTGQTAGQTGNHAVFVSAQHVDIEFRLGVFDTVGSQVAHFVDNGSVVQQGFGRDTADVQANAAQSFVTFNDGNFQAFVSGGKCSRITTRAATQYDYIVFGIGRTAELSSLRSRSRCFRCFLCRSGRRFGFRGRCCTFGLNDNNQTAFGDFVAHFNFNFFDYACNFGRDVHSRFIGFQSNQCIVHSNGIAHIYFNRNNIYIFVTANVGHFQFN